MQKKLGIKNSTTSPMAGGNYQSCRDMFNLLSTLHKSENSTNGKIPQEDAKRIMNIMRRSWKEGGKIKKLKWDREQGGIAKLIKYTNEKSKKTIRKAFGKGGYYPPSFAYALILDNKYIFTTYTEFKTLKTGPDGGPTKTMAKKFKENPDEYPEKERFMYSKEGVRDFMSKILASMLDKHT